MHMYTVQIENKRMGVSEGSQLFHSQACFHSEVIKMSGEKQTKGANWTEGGGIDATQ